MSMKYQETVNKAKEFFGEKQYVTRKEMLEFEQQTGNKIHYSFWSANRMERGLFSLEVKDSPKTVVQPEPTIALAHHADTISKFSYNALIPQINENYVEWGSNFKILESLVKSKKFFTLYITGDSGSGKNEMVSQVCAKQNRPLVRVQMTRETKEEHLIGSKTLINGSIVYEEGPVAWAAANGAILLIDEISSMDANEAMCLQNILEGGSFFVKSANKMIVPAEGFCIIATDNTKGRGSDSGRYIGTNVLNDAFLERFEMTMEQGYPSEKIERQIIDRLMKKLGLIDDQFASRLVTWVHAIRKTYLEDGIEEHITTRRACHIVNTYDKIRNADTAIELCINRFDETTKMAMLSLWSKLSEV